MGLVGLCLWGWMELAILSKDLGQPKACAPKCGAKRPLQYAHQLLFWGPRAPWDGVCEVVPVGMDGVSHLEQGPGASKNVCAKVWCKTPVMLWTSTLGLGSEGTLGWGSRAGASGYGWSYPSGAGLGATENMCAKVWCKMLLMMWTSKLVLGSVGTLGCHALHCSRGRAYGDGWS